MATMSYIFAREAEVIDYVRRIKAGGLAPASPDAAKPSPGSHESLDDTLYDIECAIKAEEASNIGPKSPAGRLNPENHDAWGTLALNLRHLSGFPVDREVRDRINAIIFRLGMGQDGQSQSPELRNRINSAILRIGTRH